MKFYTKMYLHNFHHFDVVKNNLKNKWITILKCGCFRYKTVHVTGYLTFIFHLSMAAFEPTIDMLNGPQHIATATTFKDLFDCSLIFCKRCKIFILYHSVCVHRWVVVKGGGIIMRSKAKNTQILTM